MDLPNSGPACYQTDMLVKMCLLYTIVTFQVDLKSTPQEGIHILSYKPAQRPMAGEALGLS